MARWWRRQARPDLEVELPSGKRLLVEIKRANVSLDDVRRQAAAYVSGASASAIGAASVFGWYVRSEAPWSERGHADDSAIYADWVTVGDDLWRALSVSPYVEREATQPQLFDPTDYSAIKR